MKNVALLLIATGPRYWEYAQDLIHSAHNKLTDHEVILFTDSMDDDYNHWFHVKHLIKISPMVYPEATLMRYHIFREVRELLYDYDYLLYSDVDMKFVDNVWFDDIFTEGGGITATEHPGYLGTKGTPETRPESTAYCPEPRTYFCGGFNGGASKDFLDMCYTIKENIDEDDKKGIMALWHDESHLNKYLYDNPPMRILSPSFCYPESEFKNPGGYYRQIWDRAGIGNIEPKLLALDKGKKQ